MPTFAELDAIRARPQPAYPQYGELRAEAERTAPRFVDPASLAAVGALIGRRGGEWCTAVLGYPYPDLGRGGITVVETHLLVLADRRGLDPPPPAVVLRWRAAAADGEADKRRRVAAAAERDARAWQQATAGCQVPLQVRANTRGRRTDNPHVREPLRHAVPTVAAHSGSARRPRLHPAGRALCETPGRAKPLRLADELTDQPATCVRCLAYAPKIRLAEGAQ